MEDDQENLGPSAGAKKKRCRRRRKPRSPKISQVQPVEKKQTPKKSHDAPMTKRDLYFVLNCELVSIGKGAPAVARVTMINWDAEVVLDTFVQVPVPVTDFRGTGISAEVISTHNPQAMSFAKARQAVQQTLKGKILVGYKLQDHLNSLALTHPATDVRDAAQFQLFQYEELDGVTHERLVVERSLHDLAMEFLQSELNAPLPPMDKCITALDLYKAYRKEWEDFLVRQAQSNYTKNRVPLEGTRTQLSTFDPALQIANNNVSVSSYTEEVDPAQQDRGYSWFGSNVNGSSTAYGSQESSVAQPVLTSEALEMLDYNRYGTTAYEGQHPYFGQTSSSLYESSSNRGSSSFSEYYDESSAMSDYSYAPESVSSSLHEEIPPAFPVPLPEATTSSSWFRFGSRKPRYPVQIPKEPMSSLTEEPDEIAGWTEPNTTVDLQDAPIIVDEEPNKSSEEDVVREQPTEEEKPSTVSWFSFRRPKSPRTCKKLDDFGDERDSSPPTQRREKYLKEESRAVESSDENNDFIVGPGGLNMMGPSEISPLACEHAVVEPFQESGSLEQQIETASRLIGDSEKQSSSWFSFRRTAKPSNNARDRCEQENSKEFLPESMKQPTLEADPVEVIGEEEEEEDWMREVLGSPATPPTNELLAIAWPEENAIELVHSIGGAEPPQSTPKESKWLSRFLRSSKSNGTESLPRVDGMESTSPNLWLNQSASPLRSNDPKMLNPSFFSHDDVAAAHYNTQTSSFNFMPRSRLETESTLPTVASEAEDESSSHSPIDESGKALYFIHGVDQSISFSDEEEQKFERYDKSPPPRALTSSMEDGGRVLDFVKDMEENLLFLNL